MDRVINDFVHLLRQHSVRVSPAESIEALQALHYVGLGEREVVRDTLRATLVKSRDDVEVYDRLFDLYFGFQEALDTPKPRLRGSITEVPLPGSNWAKTSRLRRVRMMK